MVWIVASLAMFLMGSAGPKRPLGCGSTSIFGTARHQLQQDLVRSVVGAAGAAHARKSQANARLFGRSARGFRAELERQHLCNASRCTSPAETYARDEVTRTSS